MSLVVDIGVLKPMPGPMPVSPLLPMDQDVALSYFSSAMCHCVAVLPTIVMTDQASETVSQPPI